MIKVVLLKNMYSDGAGGGGGGGGGGGAEGGGGHIIIITERFQRLKALYNLIKDKHGTCETISTYKSMVCKETR